MILKLGCVAKHLDDPIPTVSNSEIWVGLTSVHGLRSKMLLMLKLPQLLGTQ